MKIFFVLFCSSVYSCHLFLISSASVRSIPFLSFIVLIFAWNVPLVSNFFEEISSPSHSIIFLYFFALIAEEGFLISPCYSLELCIQMGISFLFCFAFSFSFLFLCKASYDNHFAFLHFFFLSMASKKLSSHLTVAFQWMKVFFLMTPLPCWPRQFLKIPVIPAPTPSVETFLLGPAVQVHDLLWGDKALALGQITHFGHWHVRRRSLCHIWVEAANTIARFCQMLFSLCSEAGCRAVYFLGADWMNAWSTKKWKPDGLVPDQETNPTCYSLKLGCCLCPQHNPTEADTVWASALGHLRLTAAFASSSSRCSFNRRPYSPSVEMLGSCTVGGQSAIRLVYHSSSIPWRKYRYFIS